MTTFLTFQKECAICGARNEYPGIGSTVALGSPDLDTRPPQRQRSTISVWVQRCPECGYCASSIGSAPENATLIVESTPYRKQLSDPAMPELANSFLCKAIVDEIVGDVVAAAWARLHAAWVCDDEHKAEAARECRNMAADTIRRALEKGQQFTEQPGVETAILVDVLRRSGRFSEARRLIKAKRAEIEEEIILKMLDSQESLIDRGDEACHTIDEAYEEHE